MLAGHEREEYLQEWAINDGCPRTTLRRDREEIMETRETIRGGDASKGLIDVMSAGPDCVVFVENSDHPPPHDELPVVLEEAIQRWLKNRPVQERQRVPFVKSGATGVFLWFDPV